MRTFPHGNWSTGDSCLICKTQEDKPIVLIGVVGTEKDGNMIARQVHLDCIDLLYYPDPGMLGQKL